MENSEKQPVIDEYHRQLENLIKQAGLTAERILSYAKLRIEANERLVLLASGILALTFSGALTLGSRPSFHFDQATLQSLFGAWKLLILSIVCCILANSREQHAASLLDSELLATEFQARLAILDLTGKKLNPSHSMPIQTYKKSKQAQIQEQIARLCGWAARLSVVFALVLLYVFVKRALIEIH